jgi:hypothetical protein
MGVVFLEDLGGKVHKVGKRRSGQELGPTVVVKLPLGDLPPDRKNLLRLGGGPA